MGSLKGLVGDLVTVGQATPHKPTEAVGAKTTFGILPSDYKAFSTSKHQGSKSWSNRWIIMYGVLFIVHCVHSKHHTRRATNLCPHGFRRCLNGGSWISCPQSCSNSPSAGRAGHYSSTGVVMSGERSSPSYVEHNLSPSEASVMLYGAYINRHSPNREDGLKSNLYWPTVQN